VAVAERSGAVTTTSHGNVVRFRVAKTGHEGSRRWFVGAPEKATLQSAPGYDAYAIVEQPAPHGVGIPSHDRYLVTLVSVNSTVQPADPATPASATDVANGLAAERTTIDGALARIASTVHGQRT
jgi:hypothetical protein